jgi:hypothetical protein
MKAIDSEYERISGRTFKGKYEKGCTGTPGFMENTLDHSGLTCPIHEYMTGRFKHIYKHTSDYDTPDKELNNRNPRSPI